jgi:predicted O-methyltransferase YrrM
MTFTISAKNFQGVNEELEVRRELPPGWFSSENIATYRRLIGHVPFGGIIAEIGNSRGRSLCAVSDLLRATKITVVAVDTFDDDDAIEADFKYNLFCFGILDQVSVNRSMSSLGAKLVADGSLDLIFLDADHSYEAVKTDIDAWARKVRDGGFIGGHDYQLDHPGVIRAVNESYGDKVTLESNVWFVKILRQSNPR